MNIICVNVQNYLGRGEEYVSKLYDGVARNLSRPFTFHCLTDKDVDGASGWWAKIEMFRPGRFRGRCLYFDLDTLIVGNIAHLSNYSGAFAGLSDFYHPEQFASGVMAWDADAAAPIWELWDRAGRPQFDQRGDQGWIGSVMPNADRLQTLFPSQIVSFKANCLDGIPEGARVVCFHGHPRPHVVSDIIKFW